MVSYFLIPHHTPQHPKTFLLPNSETTIEATVSPDRVIASHLSPDLCKNKTCVKSKTHIKKNPPSPPSPCGPVPCSGKKRGLENGRGLGSGPESRRTTVLRLGPGPEFGAQAVSWPGPESRCTNCVAVRVRAKVRRTSCVAVKAQARVRRTNRVTLRVRAKIRCTTCVAFSVRARIRRASCVVVRFRTRVQCIHCVAFRVKAKLGVRPVSR